MNRSANVSKRVLAWVSTVIVSISLLLSSAHIPAFGADASLAVNVPIKTVYDGPDSSLLNSSYGATEDVPSISQINEGVPVMPAGFVRRGQALHILDLAKSRIITADLSSGQRKTMSYLKNADDPFTPSDIAISANGYFVLTDFLVTLKVRALGPGGLIVKEYSIDPQLAMQPLGVVNVKVVSDDVWVQTSDGKYRQIVRNAQSVPYLAQTAMYEAAMPSAFDENISLDVTKSGDRKASVVIYRGGVPQKVNFDLSEDLNAVLSLDELGGDRYALTVLTGRQASSENANDARDELVVIIFTGGGSIDAIKQLPYVNYLDGAFRLVQVDPGVVTLMSAGETSAGVAEYVY